LFLNYFLYYGAVSSALNTCIGSPHFSLAFCWFFFRFFGFIFL